MEHLGVVLVDGGYQGEALVRWVMDTWRWVLEKVLRPSETKGFVVIPKRCVVERCFGWFRWCRRLSRDYEYSLHSAEVVLRRNGQSARERL